MKKILFLFFFVCVIYYCVSQTVPSSNITTTTRACLPPLNTFDFCNTSLSIDQRVKNLISLLQDSEKPPLLTAREGGGGSPGPPGNVSRIGLPEHDWGVNCLHGVQVSCVSDNGKIFCPTSFPNPVNYGATFNNSLAYDLGRIIATELRALWLAGTTEWSTWSGRPHAGLDCWSPNININRDPRWGRNAEVPSEDPLINGEFGVYYTKGLQEGEDSRYIKVVVTLKHWDAYSLEYANGFSRHNFNAIISNFTLQDTYFPAFKASVKQGKAKGVMCSYNAVNGVPSCASNFLNSVLREEWGFDGYITSDTGAITDIYQQHKYVTTEEEAACKAIADGGCDMDSGPDYIDSLLNGVSKGYCKMTDVDRGLYNTLKLRFELGLFDPIENQAYWKVPLSEVNTKESQDNNLLATLESMVLLKNTGNVLPLPIGKNIAVLGPHVDAQATLISNYYGQICPSNGFDCVQTPFEAISKYNVNGTTTKAYGIYSLTKNTTAGFADALKVATAADYVVLLLGINTTVESESHDRSTIDLPYIQHLFAKAVMGLNKPTVLVLFNGGMVSIEQEKEIVPAILEAGYPGFMGAEAVAMTLFGKNTHLGGKLPYTIYPADYIYQINMTEMEMNVGPGRSYKYYTGTPIYPFGYGISLTTFSLTTTRTTRTTTEGIMNTQKRNQIKNENENENENKISTIQFFTQKIFLNNGKGESTTILVNVTNTGKYEGDEVVFFYISPISLLKSEMNSNLIKQLVGYQRVHLIPNQSETIEFEMNQNMLNLVHPDNGDILNTPGTYSLIVTNGVDIENKFPILLIGDDVIVEKFPKY